ncbi:MAG: PAS domain-containing protein, partial [Deltaproteobacteria bacterium]|nr:PAS domain-containing protein [Candidatus Tharpella sp.]
MPANFLFRFKVSSFVKYLIALSLAAAAGLIIFPHSAYSNVFSLVSHFLLALVLLWFMVQVVWPVRVSLDRMILLVEKHKEGSQKEPFSSSEVIMGNYQKIIDNAVNHMESQYEDLLSHSRQLENFTQVLEKQNQKINESRQRYRRSLDALESGLYLIDDKYSILAINRSEAAYFGVTPKELVGKKCYQVFRQRTSPCPDCMPRDCMIDGQSRERLRFEGRRSGRKYANIFCYPILHEGDNNNREVVINIQDASPLVMMEDKIIRAEKMASIGQMAAGIAHDLNNYLAAIYGIVQLLQMRLEETPAEHEKDLKLLGRLKDQVEALNLMAGNLMVFSHPGRKELFPLSLNQVIDDALSFSRYELERESVCVIKGLAEDLPSCYMEKGQIQQVILDLMLNAVQAIRERKAHLEDDFSGQVTIATGLEDEKHIFFTVSDNGVGITAACQDHLFDPFFSTKEVNAEVGATGLGLFTAKTILEQHQG